MDKKLSIAYFSPTNGTKNATNLLAKEISNEYQSIDLTNPENREKIYKFSSDSLVIFSAPVYMGQLPKVDGLFNNLRGNNTACILMAAYGNRAFENTLAQMKNILEKRGFITIGAIAPIIPHIYSKKLGTNRPDNIDILKFKEFSIKLLNKLTTNNIKTIELPGESNPPLAEGKSSTIKNLDKSKCTNCMNCAKNCPVSAISFENLEIDSNLCINCMSCSKVCPSNARTFNCTAVQNYLESNYLRRKEVEYFI